MQNISWTRNVAALLLFAAAILAAPAARAEDAKPARKSGKAQVFTVDPKASELRWVGRKVTGQHNGTVALKGGQIQVQNGAASGGTLVIDMPSIKVLDLTDAKSNTRLTDHLKSDDFFGVDKHPTATFKVKKIQPIAGAKEGGPNAQVKGELTVKGVTHPADFPATITVQDGTARASAAGVKIDRTLYDIRYRSGKFFPEIGDKMIYDDFTIDFDVVAKKKSGKP